jgi:tetratricopeptide (TPR) repeat protein
MRILARLLAAAAILISSQAPAGETANPATKAEVGVPAPSDVPDPMAERNTLVAELYGRLRQTRDAETNAKITTALERLWVWSGSDTADLLLSRAAVAIEAKQPEVARQVLDALIAIEPGYAEAWNRRAYLNYSEQKLQAALSDLAHVLTIDPLHFKALEGLGSILKEMGQKRQALKAFRLVLEINPLATESKEAVEALEREVEGQKI